MDDDEDDDGDTDDSEAMYIPSILRSKTSVTPSKDMKPKPQKITKKVKKKKKKTISTSKKPPRKASPSLGRQRSVPLGGSDNV